MDKNKYEALLVFNMQGKEDGINEAISRVEKIFQAEGATIEEIQRLERREFAYEHKHTKSGYFTNFIFSATAVTIEKLRSKLKLDDDVTLQNFIRLSDK